jgi:chemotaxis protein methyltransferase CheR
MIDMNDVEFRLFKEYLSNMCGIEVPPEKRYLFVTRMSGLLEEIGCSSFSQFYARLVDKSGAELKGRLVEAMTTNETGFFRDSHPFQALQKQLLPAIGERRRAEMRYTRPRIRILSAGCSTGEEPFSIAMCVSEWLKRDEFFTRNDISITGIDISRRVLEQARSGRYPSARFEKSIPQEYVDNYFESSSTGRVLRPQIRAMVSFEEINLAEPFELSGPFDVVFFRNVMIYFAAELKTEVVGRIYDMLRPEGILFLGASESMYPFSERFRTVHTDETTYYVRV